jgi:hypothetical protein
VGVEKHIEYERAGAAAGRRGVHLDARKVLRAHVAVLSRAGEVDAVLDGLVAGLQSLRGPTTP